MRNLRQAGRLFISLIQWTKKAKAAKSFSAIGVDSIDDTIAAVEANGGKIVMPKFHIPNVGTLIFFEDTEGNVVGAMQYDKQ